MVPPLIASCVSPTTSTDANKDGVLTLQEIQEFMRGTRTAAPRQ
jgi:hypothetical protein